MSNNSSDAPLSKKLQDKFFEMAKNVSTLSDFYKQHHLGCVITYKNKVIGDGYNSLKTHPIQKEYNKYRNYRNNFETPNNGSLHAEMMALLRCKDYDIEWNKVNVFIYRCHKNDIKANAFCCPACRQALIDRGIKRIYYTTENGTLFEKID